MIFGRSTPQWIGLITATLSFVQIVVQYTKPEWADEAAVILPALGVLLGGYITFLAQTATTPLSDPILPSGTTVTVQDTEDKVVIQPTPPGPVGVNDAGAADGDVDDPPTDPIDETTGG